MSLPSFALYAAIAAFTFYLLIVGRALILPFVVAVVFWYLIATLSDSYRRIAVGRTRLPSWLALTCAILTFALILAAFVDLTLDNVGRVQEAAAGYEENLRRMVSEMTVALGIERLPTLDELLQQLDLRGIAGELATAITGFVGNVGIILVYVLFLLVEQRNFTTKLRALVPDDGRRARVAETLARVNADIRTYLWVKTVLSVATGGISYIVMASVGLDFAEFWAVVIFLLNYIPTIGSILGIVFPTLLTLVQFPEPLTPFLIVLVCLAATQIVIGNVVEPRMIGKSLNLSPLVIIVSLALWGTIWGVIGMFLSVPITVIAMVVMAQFRTTRPVAVALSADGTIGVLTEDAGRAV